MAEVAEKTSELTQASLANLGGTQTAGYAMAS